MHTGCCYHRLLECLDRELNRVLWNKPSSAQGIQHTLLRLVAIQSGVYHSATSPITGEVGFEPTRFRDVTLVPRSALPLELNHRLAFSPRSFQGIESRVTTVSARQLQSARLPVPPLATSSITHRANRGQAKNNKKIKISPHLFLQKVKVNLQEPKNVMKTASSVP